MGFLSRGLQKAIDKASIVDGKLRFAIDTRRIFLDTATERIEFTDNIKGLKYSEILALKSPLPKVYFSSDTHQMMIYDFKDEKWIIYSGGIAVEDAITDIKYDNDNNIIITYGDKHTKIIENPLSKKVSNLNIQVEEMKKTIEKFEKAISIVE